MGISLLFVIGSRSGAVNRTGSENEAEQSFLRPRTMTDTAGAKPTENPLRPPSPRKSIPHQGGSYRVCLWVSFLRCRDPQAAEASAPSHFQRNSPPSIHMRCMMTPRRRASATFARALPRRFATPIVHAFSHDHRVAAFGDSSRAVDLSRLPFARRKPEVRAHRARAHKTRRHVDARPESQRNRRTCPGDRHQATANRVGAHRLQHHSVQPDVFRQ